MTSQCASGRLNYFPLAAPRTSPLVGIRVCSFAQLALGCSNPSLYGGASRFNKNPRRFILAPMSWKLGSWYGVRGSGYGTVI